MVRHGWCGPVPQTLKRLAWPICREGASSRGDRRDRCPRLIGLRHGELAIILGTFLVLRRCEQKPPGSSSPSAWSWGSSTRCQLGSDFPSILDAGTYPPLTPARSRRWTISAYSELQADGQFGAECLNLTRRLMREEARRFPSMAPAGGWHQDDLDDLTGDFFADRIRPVTTMLVVQAGDDASAGRLLRRSIRHWLIDRVRKTGEGALRRRLEEVLAGHDGFEQVPAGAEGAGRWRLARSGTPPWSGRLADLVEAARAVPRVKIPQWSLSARRSPVADKASIVAVARAAIQAAGGSLEIAELTAVFTARFPAALDPVIVPLPDDPDLVARDADPTPEERQVAADEELDSGVSAEEIVGMLNPAERQLMPHLDDQQAIQTILGCGRSQAYYHAGRLKAKLSQLLGETEDMRAVAREVIRLCSDSAADR